MLNLQKPTLVTIVDIKYLYSEDPKCPTTAIIAIAGQNGVKRQIYLRNTQPDSSLQIGTTIVVMEKKNIHTRFLSEYEIWKDGYIHNLVVNQK